MKYLIAMLPVFFSSILYAQISNQPDTTGTKMTKQQTSNAVKTNPVIPVSPAINTTVTKSQPLSIPSSNTNPTTGTVINLKSNKNTSKTSRSSGTPTSDTIRIVNSSTNKTSPRKRATKKNKAYIKKVN